MAELSRRRVTYSQLETLWEVLNKRRDIALGYNKTSHAREYSRRLWEEVALSLNSQDGAEKDWKGWCKYWNDYKSKLKKLAAASRRSHQQTGGGPSIIKKFTDIEKKFLQIVGENYGLGLPGIRVEPFEEDVHEGTSNVSDGQGGSESILTGLQLHTYELILSQPPPPSTSPPPLPTTPTGLPPTPTAIPSTSTALASTPTALPSTPTALPPPQSTPLPRTPQHEPTFTNHPSTPQRVSPRRRRPRGERPITAEVARKFFMQESRRRAEIDERNSTMLRELIDELKQIKDILRFNGLPTSGA